MIIITMKFKSKPTTMTYNINNLAVTEKTTHHDLGVIFSASLQWRQHYKNITAKAYNIRS